MLIAEQFIQSSAVRKYGKHSVSTDGVWNMVSANLQIFETKTSSHSFTIREKYY